MRAWTQENFGGPRHFARFWASRALASLGAYRTAAKLPGDGFVRRLVFVCTGNVCRSPYAERVVAAAGVPAVSVGTRTDGGVVANERAREVAAGRGVDLSGHLSQKLQSFERTDTDLFVCMEPLQFDRVRKTYGDAHVVLLGMFGSVKRPYIPDPYGKEHAYFERCFSWIEEHVEVLVSSSGVRDATDIQAVSGS